MDEREGGFAEKTKRSNCRRSEEDLRNRKMIALSVLARLCEGLIIFLFRGRKNIQIVDSIVWKGVSGTVPLKRRPGAIAFLKKVAASPNPTIIVPESSRLARRWHKYTPDGLCYTPPPLRPLHRHVINYVFVCTV